MSAFFYLKKETFLHNRDPRVKIAGFLFFCAMAVIAGNITEMAVLLCVLLMFFLRSRSCANLEKTAGLFLLIGTMTFILWLLFYPGTEKIYIWRGFSVYSGAVPYAAVMSLRFINMLLAGLLFLSVTSIEDFYGGMIILGLPYGFAFAVSLSFRLVMVFMSNAFTIVEAQKVRGNDVSRGGIIRRIKAYTPLIVPFILNGIKKAETLTLALESKGFSPQNRINLNGKYCLTKRDKLSLWIMLFMVLLWGSGIGINKISL